MKELELADIYFKKLLMLADSIKSDERKASFYGCYIPYLIKNNRMDEAKWFTDKYWQISRNTQNLSINLDAIIKKKELFDNLNNTDSAYYYSKLESETRQLIFNQDNLNAIQAMTFKEQLRKMEDAANRLKKDQLRKQNIQYSFIVFGILTFIIFFVILSRSIIVNEKWISFFGILGLLIVFEFIYMLIHPFLESATHHSPLLMLLALVIIASLLIPLHHRIEKWIKEKMTEKNRRIRLEAAKKTIEKLEGEAPSK